MTHRAGKSERIRPPEETLALLKPHLEETGITRCADLTGLDRLGIPVCCAFTPANPILQAAWGKGVRAVDARASAIMEAVERYHGCLHDARERVASLSRLRTEAREAVEPCRLQRHDPQVCFSERLRIPWLPMEVLSGKRAGDEIHVPASAVYPGQPQVCRFTANGLAGGNCLEEAQSAALYEIIERDGISSCFDGTGRLLLKRNGTLRIDLSRCRHEALGGLLERIQRAGIELVLLMPPGRVKGVNIVWAVLIDTNSPLLWTRINIGYGANFSPAGAAVRAITEAAQSRIAYLHGCREDMGHKMLYPDAGRVDKTVRYFSSFVPGIAWNDLEDEGCTSLKRDWDGLFDAAVSSGFDRIYRLQIPSRIKGIRIVKLIVEGTLLRHGIF